MVNIYYRSMGARMIIAISGTPGTGKTTVAKLLGERLGYEVISLNDFAREKNLLCGYDERRKCDIVDVEKIKSELRKLKKKNLVIESHYAHDMDSDVLIILRTNPGELRKRGREKGWRREKIEENVLAEIMEICKSEALEQGKGFYEIDTSNKTPKDVVDEIVKNLNINRKLSKTKG